MGAHQVTAPRFEQTEYNPADLWEEIKAANPHLSDADVTHQTVLHLTRARQNTHQGQFAEGERQDAQPDFNASLEIPGIGNKANDLIGGATGKVLSAALHGGQGASLGLSDELSLDPEAARMALDASREQNPVASVGSDLAASMLVPVPGVGSAGRGAAKAVGGALGKVGLKEAVKAGVKTGGLMGGANAFGRSEGNPLQRVPNTIAGSVTGAALGGLIPSVSQGAEALAEKFPPSKWLIQAGREFGKRWRGGDTALGRIAEEVRTEAESLGQKLSDDDINNIAARRLIERQTALTGKAPEAAKAVEAAAPAAAEPAVDPTKLRSQLFGSKGATTPEEQQALMDKLSAGMKKQPDPMEVPTFQRRSSTVGGGATNQRFDDIVSEARARRPINPSTGKEVTEQEVQGAIDKETRINKEVAERKQQGAPRRRLSKNLREMAERYAQLSDDELAARIQQSARRTDDMADTVREMLQAELQRRAS